MRILVCDSNKNIRMELIDKLKCAHKEITSDDNLSIVSMENTFKLKDYFEDKKIEVDAVFISISKEIESRVNGIDMAKYIKNEYPYVSIVFYTDKPVCLNEMFEANPIWVVTKPYKQETMNNVILKILENRETNKYISIRKKGELVRIKANDITYIESQGKYIKIHTQDNCISTINKLDNIKEQLGNVFMFCHKSYLVNTNKIMKFDLNKLTLFDNTEIAVSRSYKLDVKDFFSDCL